MDCRVKPGNDHGAKKQIGGPEGPPIAFTADRFRWSGVA
jgi:hypothetical protein